MMECCMTTAARKRCYSLLRMRFRGLAKAIIQFHLTAIAYNFKHTMNILSVPA